MYHFFKIKLKTIKRKMLKFVNQYWPYINFILDILIIILEFLITKQISFISIIYLIVKEIIKLVKRRF